MTVNGPGPLSTPFAQIAPSKGNLLRTVNPADVAYEFGAVYHENTFYPAAVAEIGTPYIMRDFRGIVIRVNPFQFNPATGVLRSYSRITVELTAAGPGCPASRPPPSYLASFQGPLSARGSFGRPSTRSPMMLRWTWLVPA